MAGTTDAAGASVTTTLHMPSPTNGTGKPASAETTVEEPISIWEKIFAIPKAEWANNAIIYVYRLGHQTRALATGQKGYLDVLAEPITPDYIKKRWGGGRFRIMVIRNGVLFAKAEEDIEGDPIFERSESANGHGSAAPASADNAALLKMFEEHMRSMREQIVALQGSLQNQAPAAGTDRSIDLVAKGAERALDIATKQAGPQANPIEQFNAILATAERIAAARQQPSGFDKLLELLAPLVPDLLKRALNPANPLDEITKAMPLIELFDKLRGSNGDGVPVNSQTAIVQAISQNAPELLKTWNEVSQRNEKAALARREAEEMRLQSLERFSKLTPQQRDELRRHGGREYAREAGRDTPAPTPARRDNAAPPVNTVPPANAAPGATDKEITQEQFDTIVKQTVVSMVVSGANPETVADYLLSTKPDVCRLIAKNPNATIKLFFERDEILKPLITHVTQTETGVEDFDGLMNAVREYIIECEKTEPVAAAPN